jgi:hypothetical protein
MLALGQAGGGTEVLFVRFACWVFEKAFVISFVMHLLLRAAALRGNKFKFKV